MHSWTNLKMKSALGTMSFGAHVDELEAGRIMDRALELGVNFFDTAELYSVPTSVKTCGITEEIIGRWMARLKSRGKIYLASKVVGPNRGGDNYIRFGKARFDVENIEMALHGSLKRLKTDYLDLYQLHWPDRELNTFGKRNFEFVENEDLTSIEETLRVLERFQKAGKIKDIGISNESAWGFMEFLRISRENNLPRVSFVQNNFSLLTRTYETSLAEVSYRENVPLLAYSCLGFGGLTDFPRKNGRYDLYPNEWARYRTPLVNGLIDKYRDLAHRFGLTLPELAYAFVSSRKFVGKVLLGPATVDQLENGVKAVNLELSVEILEEIEKIHETCPNICP